MKFTPNLVGLRPLLKINIRHIIIVGWVDPPETEKPNINMSGS